MEGNDKAFGRGEMGVEERGVIFSADGQIIIKKIKQNE